MGLKGFGFGDLTFTVLRVWAPGLKTLECGVRVLRAPGLWTRYGGCPPLQIVNPQIYDLMLYWAHLLSWLKWPKPQTLNPFRV